MSNHDWKQAMLNEAEASRDEVWAEETRRAATFDFWAFSWAHLPLYFLSIFLLNFFTYALMDLSAWVLPTSTSGGLILLAAIFAALHAAYGWLLYRWGIRGVLLLAVFGPSHPLQSTPLLQAVGSDGLLGLVAPLVMDVVLAGVPLALGFWYAYRRGLARI